MRRKRIPRLLELKHRENGEKRCCRCETVLPLDKFCKKSQSIDGKMSHCRDCNRARSRISNWQQRGINISMQDYKQLLAMQNDSCAICGREGSGEPHDVLVPDHDHKTGATRGLLCLNCNVGIGNLKDSIELLDSAKTYLRKYQTCQVSV